MKTGNSKNSRQSSTRIVQDVLARNKFFFLFCRGKCQNLVRLSNCAQIPNWQVKENGAKPGMSVTNLLFMVYRIHLRMYLVLVIPSRIDRSGGQSHDTIHIKQTEKFECQILQIKYIDNMPSSLASVESPVTKSYNNSFLDIMWITPSY